MKQLLKTILPVLLFVWGTGIVAAFADDDTFNPSNPPEPNALYKVEVVADDADGGNVSGSGSYSAGQSVRINASCKTGFKFVRWDMYVDSVFTQSLTTQSFYHTVTANKVRYVAYFLYDPTSPAEPSYTAQYKIYLTCDPEEACSFNINSGTRVDVNTNKTITAYPSQGFVLLGWYDDSTGALVASTASFSHRVTADVHFTARFEYDPTSPTDPSSGQTDVLNPAKGDADCSGEIDVNDITVTATYIRGGNPKPFDAGAADVDGNGDVDVNDIVRTAEIIRNSVNN